MGGGGLVVSLELFFRNQPTHRKLLSFWFCSLAHDSKPMKGGSFHEDRVFKLPRSCYYSIRALYRNVHTRNNKWHLNKRPEEEKESVKKRTLK